MIWGRPIGWFDDVTSAVTGAVINPIGSVFGGSVGGPVGSYLGGISTGAFGPGGAAGNLANAAFPNWNGTPSNAGYRNAYDARRSTLRNSVVTAGKELDDFTRAKLLEQIDSVANYNGDLNGLESLFAQAKGGDQNFVNLRQASLQQKTRKETPGMAAQTMLTSNINGTAPNNVAGGPQPLSKGQPSGGSLLT